MIAALLKRAMAKQLTDYGSSTPTSLTRGGISGRPPASIAAMRSLACFMGDGGALPRSFSRKARVRQ